MAQSYINLKEGYRDESLALYYQDKLVGFTKIVFVPKDVKPYHLSEDAYMIDALIIDQTFQGKGYGKAALYAIINYCKSFPFAPAKNIVLVCYEENLPAQSLFKQFNFTKSEHTKSKKKTNLYVRQITETTLQ